MKKIYRKKGEIRHLKSSIFSLSRYMASVHFLSSDSPNFSASLRISPAVRSEATISSGENVGVLKMAYLRTISMTL